MLTSLAARLAQFDGRVAATHDSVEILRRKVRWWTSFAATAVTVLLAWFCLSQIHMLVYGWRFLARP